MLQDLLESPITESEQQIVNGLDTLLGQICPRDILSLYRLAATQPPGAWILEVGSFMGKSANVLGRGMPLNATLVCVDDWTSYFLNDCTFRGITAIPQDHFEGFRIFLRNTAWLQDRLIVLRGKAGHQLPFISPRKFNLIFIDSDHTEPATRVHIRLSIPLLKPGGIFCVHDYTPGIHGGVIRAVDDMVGSRDDCEESGKVPGSSLWCARLARTGGEPE